MDWKKLDVKETGLCAYCVSNDGDLDVGDTGVGKVQKWD